MKQITLLILLITLIPFSSHSQQNLRSSVIQLSEKHKDSLEKLFKNFDVFQIDLNSLNRVLADSTDTHINWYINDEHHYDLVVYPKDIRSSGYIESFSISSNDKSVQSIQKSNTYRGQIKNGGFVRLTITDDFIYGIIETINGLMVIDQLKYVLHDKSIPSNQVVIYNADGIIEINGFCGTDNKVKKPAKNQQKTVSKTITTDCLILEVATDADFEYFQEYGNNSNNRILGEFNNIQGVYANTLDLEIVIVYQNVWTTAGDPYSLNSNNTNNEISTTWQNTFGNVDRDLVHMFTGKDFGNLFGIASDIGDVCADPNSNSFTVDRISAFRTTGHEIGHNLGGIHGDGQFCGTGNASVMCRGDKRIPIYFSNASIVRIENYINANNACLFEFENMAITGNNGICINNTGNYTLDTPLQGNITWSLSNSFFTIIAGQGTNTVTVRGVNVGSTILTASIDINGTVCGNQTISKTIVVGKPKPRAGTLPQICTNPALVGVDYTLPVSPGADSYRLVSNAPFPFLDFSNEVTFTNAPRTISLIPFAAGTYTLTLYTTNSCGTSSTSYPVTVENCSGGFYFSIYPNPTGGRLYISDNSKTNPELDVFSPKGTLSNASNKDVWKKSELERPIEITIYDMNGTIMLEYADNNNTGFFQLDIGDMPSGIYLLRIKKNGADEMHRIIKGSN